MEKGVSRIGMYPIDVFVVSKETSLMIWFARLASCHTF